MLNVVAMLGPEPLLLIFILVLVLFGGKKIPELMRGVGRGVGELQRGLDEGKTMISTSIREEQAKVEEKKLEERAKEEKAADEKTPVGTTSTGEK